MCFSVIHAAGGHQCLFCSWNEYTFIHLSGSFYGIFPHACHSFFSISCADINPLKGFGCRLLLPLLGMVLLKHIMQTLRTHCYGRTCTSIIFTCPMYAKTFIYALKWHLHNSAKKIRIYTFQQLLFAQSMSVCRASFA